jgi:hypothetical protein
MRYEYNWTQNSVHILHQPKIRRVAVRKFKIVYIKIILDKY